MRIIIEINENKEASVQVSGATTGVNNAAVNSSARPEMNAVDAGRAKVGTVDQGSPSMQNENFAAQNEGTSAGSGPGGQAG